MANTKISADQVEELLLKGKSHGGVLTYREIMDSMQNVEDMTPDDMDSMYELIAQKGIDVVDENSDDDVLPVNDDDTEEINEAELANLSVPEGVSIDDPVRMYLILSRSFKAYGGSAKMKSSLLNVWIRENRPKG